MYPIGVRAPSRIQSKIVSAVKPINVPVTCQSRDRQVQRRQQGEVPEAVEDERRVGEGELEVDESGGQGKQDDPYPERGGGV
jgi:hypothetical protein